MAATEAQKPINTAEEEDWEYEEEDADDYEWEYSEEEEEIEGAKENGKENGKVKLDDEDDDEEDIPLDEQDLPDPFSAAPLEATTKKEVPNGTNGEKKKKREKNGDDENGKKHRHRHKKSRHLERIEMFSKKENQPSDRSKKIHVRSKDPSRIAKQFEKNMTSKPRAKGVKAPPVQKITEECKICGKVPYLVERITAEKSWWHKNCFRCSQCNKILNLDTYMSHEGILYCKPHHTELFRPKVVKRDIEIDVEPMSEEAIARHQEQQRRRETIIRESKPVDLGDQVVKSKPVDKYAGLENLDVGSKFKMFENAGRDEDKPVTADRYGIMERLRRLQDGEDVETLLAEIEEELPSTEEEDDEIGMSNVQKKTHNAERLFEEGGQERKKKLEEDRRLELKHLREKLMAGTRDNVLDQFEDTLSAGTKIKKTKVDVRSENAKKFRDMFDKGEVPEGLSSSDKMILEKEAELEQMRKGKRDQRDYFKQLEEGKVEERKTSKPKLLVGKINKDSNGNPEEAYAEAAPEMTSLSNKFSFFENYEEKMAERASKKQFRMTPPRDGEEEGDESDDDHQPKAPRTREADIARKECKAKSVLNKFKEMERKALNGETEDVQHDDPDKPVMTALGFLGRLPGVADRRPTMKRFTPPRKGSDESDYSDDSDYSDSEYSSSYTGSDSYSSESEEDEDLRAIREAARAKQLRAKFEEWEQTQDAQEQLSQIMAFDAKGENGESIDTASHLKAKFEQMQLEEQKQQAQQRFRPKRFK